MSKATIQVEGLVARDVEVRRTQSGSAVATVVVPHTPRRKNRDTGEWEDAAATTWCEASLWNEAAEQVADIQKGDLVLISGQPQVEVYEKRDGSSGAKLKIVFATVGVIRRAGGGQGGAGRTQTASADQWATPAAFDAQAQAQHVQGGWDDAPAPF